MAVPNERAIIYEFFTDDLPGPSLGVLDSEIDSDDISIVLSAGFTPLEQGARPIKIGNELVVVSGTGDTLTVDGKGRGYFGTTPVTHVEGTTVTRASFSDVVGTNIFPLRMDKEFDGSEAGVEYRVIGRHGISNRELRKPRVQVKLYGGKNQYGEITHSASHLVLMLLIERTHLVQALPIKSGYSYDSGVVVSAEADDNEGQDITDISIKPGWPLTLGNVDFEVRFK